MPRLSLIIVNAAIRGLHFDHEKRTAKALSDRWEQNVDNIEAAYYIRSADERHRTEPYNLYPPFPVTLSLLSPRNMIEAILGP